MGTDFQIIIDRFLSKEDKDFEGKEGLILEYLKSAVSKSKKTVDSDLVYYIIDNETGEGYFKEELEEEEIEYIAQWMVYSEYEHRKNYLINLKREIGSKDFALLPDKVKEIKELNSVMETKYMEILRLKDEFNTYDYQ